MQYFVRIEMHHQKSEAYTRLHAAEAEQGFSRTFTNSIGAKDRRGVPSGDCWMESSNDAWFVLEAAKRAVLPIDADAMIVVAGGPEIVYWGYPKVSVPESPIAEMLRVGLGSPRRAVASNLLGGARTSGPLASSARFASALIPPPEPETGSLSFFLNSLQAPLKR